MSALSAINPFDMDPARFQAIRKITAGGMGAVSEGAQKHQPQLRGFQEQGLDQAMLAQKAANFQVGLGGTNNPDNHKIFLVG